MAETGSKLDREIRLIPEPTGDLMTEMLGMLHFAAPGAAVKVINIRWLDSHDRYVLESGHCLARRGDLIYLVNKTEYTAQSAGLAALFGHELTIAPGAVAGEKVPESATNGSYPYQMVVNEVSVESEDGTMPEIIIDD